MNNDVVQMMNEEIKTYSRETSPLKSNRFEARKANGSVAVEMRTSKDDELERQIRSSIMHTETAEFTFEPHANSK